MISAERLLTDSQLEFMASNPLDMVPSTSEYQWMARELIAARGRVALLQANYEIAHEAAGRSGDYQRQVTALEQQLRAQGLSQEDRAALDRGAICLDHFAEYILQDEADSVIYRAHAAILRRLGGQTI